VWRSVVMSRRRSSSEIGMPNSRTAASVPAERSHDRSDAGRGRRTRHGPGCV
jgi:hypothetical protein